MSKYALVRYDVIKGRRQFFKLVVDPVIEKGKLVSYKRCEYDEFWQTIENEGNFSKQLPRLDTFMDLFSSGKSLPINHYNPNLGIDGAAEFKTKDLRLYVFHYSPLGYVIICGGKKNSQRSDISHLESLISDIQNHNPLTCYEYEGKPS